MSNAVDSQKSVLYILGRFQIPTFLYNFLKNSLCAFAKNVYWANLLNIISKLVIPAQNVAAVCNDEKQLTLNKYEQEDEQLNTHAPVSYFCASDKYISEFTVDKCIFDWQNNSSGPDDPFLDLVTSFGLASFCDCRIYGASGLLEHSLNIR